MNRASIYPCASPQSYLLELGEANCLWVPLAEGIVALLCVDQGESISGLHPSSLAQYGLSSQDEAWALAYENLAEAVQGGQVPIQVLDCEAGAKVAILGPHWLASAIFHLEGVHDWMAQLLSSESIRVAIPAREVAIVYPSDAPSSVLQSTRELVAHAASTSAKPFGSLSFQLLSDGLGPGSPIGA